MEKEKVHMDMFGKEKIKNFINFINENKSEKSENDRIRNLKNSDFINEIISLEWEPYIVGGFVRDYIMGKPSKDIDLIIVGCDKDELITLLKKYGNPNLVGESFSVIKFDYNGEEYDIAIPRIEKKIDKGYKGFEVVSNKNITLEQDLFRRDLTINSIAMDLDGNYIDPYGGISDIKNKIIRVTNPKAFTEDPLRILRSIRFAARYNFYIDSETSQKIIKIKDKIRELSQERIIEELNKMWEHTEKSGSVDMFFDYLRLLKQYKMFAQMFPGLVVEIDDSAPLDFNIVLMTMFKDNDNLMQKMVNLKFPSRVAKLVSFLTDIVNDLDEDEEKIYNLMIKRSKFDPNILSEVDDYVITLGKEGFIDLDDADKFVKFCNMERVSGNDLMAQGFKGVEIGKEKKRRELKKFNDM